MLTALYIPSQLRSDQCCVLLGDERGYRNQTAEGD
jgi:hypothetical protein